MQENSAAVGGFGTADLVCSAGTPDAQREATAVTRPLHMRLRRPERAEAELNFIDIFHGISLSDEGVCTVSDAVRAALPLPRYHIV